MAQFSQRFIRSVIRQVWNQAPAGGATFLEALNTCQSGHWENVGTGWTVQSSSGAGYSTSFHIPSGPGDPSNITPQAFQELFELILEGYALVIKSGVAEDDAADATQSAFVAALWALFPTIKGTTNNFMFQNP